MGFEKAASREFVKAIASLEEVFAFLETFYASAGVEAGDAFTISLVVEELFTNLVKYNTSSRNPIAVHLAREDSLLRLALVDRDVDRFDPASLPEPNVEAPMEQRKPGGLGLHLVRAIVDRITFDYHQRVMRIEVEKQLESSRV